MFWGHWNDLKVLIIDHIQCSFVDKTDQWVYKKSVDCLVPLMGLPAGVNCRRSRGGIPTSFLLDVFFYTCRRPGHLFHVTYTLPDVINLRSADLLRPKGPPPYNRRRGPLWKPLPRYSPERPAGDYYPIFPQWYYIRVWWIERFIVSAREGRPILSDTRPSIVAADVATICVAMSTSRSIRPIHPCTRTPRAHRVARLSDRYNASIAW